MTTPALAAALSDQELLRRVQARDAAAVVHLYRRYGAQVYSLLAYMLRDAATAEELTQEVFFAISQKLEQYDPARGALSTWILNIARHQGIDHLRAVKRRIQPQVFLDADPSRAESVSAGVSLDSDGAILRLLLERLPPEQRQAIELSYYHGYTHEEIATGLGIPAGTVKSRLLLGLRKLRQMMAEESASTGGNRKP